MYLFNLFIKLLVLFLQNKRENTSDLVFVWLKIIICWLIDVNQVVDKSIVGHIQGGHIIVY